MNTKQDEVSSINSIYPQSLNALKGLGADKKIDKLFESDKYPMPFSFNSEVAEVFDDMVTRSIPMYYDALTAVSKLIEYQNLPKVRICDIGCSTGLMARFLQKNNAIKHGQYVGIDSSKDMIEQANKLQPECGNEIEETGLHCEFHSANALTFEYRDFDYVILNYILQFLPVPSREELISRAYAGLKPGGVMIISEKTRSNSSFVQEYQTKLYESYKRERKYSEREIFRKKEALENVLVPFSNEDYSRIFNRLHSAKFEKILQWMNFSTWVVCKN